MSGVQSSSESVCVRKRVVAGSLSHADVLSLYARVKTDEKVWRTEVGPRDLPV